MSRAFGKLLLLAGGLCLIMVTTASACLWDSDTLYMERMRFPATLEIITGKFVRHGQAYYEWRILDRTKKLAAKPDDPALLDDLAVAYAKLGRPEEGIALLEPTLARRPDRYETLSNLGTLLFFAGRLDESKEYIRRALEVNPDAHFGRERYQLLLTEYFQQSEHATKGVMASQRATFEGGSGGFGQYVMQAEASSTGGDRSDSSIDLDVAVKGVLGMMHFADHESPILLEALGDLLLMGGQTEDATQLAARAYLRAAQQSPDPEVAVKFKEMAKQAVAHHEDFGHSGQDSLAILEKQLGREMEAADAWYAAIESQEKQWIAQGRDVDAEFATNYYESIDSTVAAAQEQLQSEPRDVRFTQDQRFKIMLIIAGVILVGIPVSLVCLTTLFVIWWRRRKRAAANRLMLSTDRVVT